MPVRVSFRVGRRAKDGWLIDADHPFVKGQTGDTASLQKYLSGAPGVLDGRVMFELDSAVICQHSESMSTICHALGPCSARNAESVEPLHFKRLQ